LEASASGWREVNVDLDEERAWLGFGTGGLKIGSLAVSIDCDCDCARGEFRGESVLANGIGERGEGNCDFCRGALMVVVVVVVVVVGLDRTGRGVDVGLCGWRMSEVCA